MDAPTQLQLVPNAEPYLQKSLRILPRPAERGASGNTLAPSPLRRPTPPLNLVFPSHRKAAVFTQLAFNKKFCSWASGFRYFLKTQVWQTLVGERHTRQAPRASMGDELCSVCEEYIAEWFCRKCGRNICQVCGAVAQQHDRDAWRTTAGRRKWARTDVACLRPREARRTALIVHVVAGMRRGHPLDPRKDCASARSHSTRWVGVPHIILLASVGSLHLQSGLCFHHGLLLVCNDTLIFCCMNSRKCIQWKHLSPHRSTPLMAKDSPARA